MRIGDGGVADAERLAAISAAADHATLTALRALLPGHPATVLDVGCGNGSVAIGLADMPGVRAVYALDRDLALLPDPVPARVRPVAGDVVTWAPGYRFDLVHARFVLAHLAERDAVTARLASWLAPGGHLVITEAYHLPGGDPRVREVLAEYRRVVERGGMSFDFARQVPDLLLAAGLAEVTVTARPGRLGGGAGVDRFAPLVRRVEHLLSVQPDTLDGFYAYAAAPDTYDIPQLILTTTGRSPKPTK